MSTELGLIGQQLDDLRAAIYEDMIEDMAETQRRSEAWRQVCAEVGYGNCTERDAYEHYLKSVGVSDGFLRALFRLDEARRAAKRATVS